MSSPRSIQTLAVCGALLALGVGARWTRARSLEAAPPGAGGLPEREALEEAAFLGLRPPLDEARHYVASAIHNPSGWQLAPEDEAELQALIDAANAELEELHGQMSETARAWSRLRIANGYFEEARPGEDRRHHQGSLLLRVTDRYGIRRDVVIWPGECAELDVLTADIDAHIENAHRQVADFVESRGLPGDEPILEGTR
jgi:hypothetical protein